MTPEAILKTMRAQRAVWLDLEPGKRVQVSRPREAEVVEHFLRPKAGGGYTLMAELPQVQQFVVGWEGFKESDFIGAAGASDPLPFSAELWAEWISDHLALVPKVAQQLIDSIAAHTNAKEAAEKNSQPSSTPPTARSGTESSQ